MLIDMGRMVEDVFRQSKTGDRKCNVTWLASRLNCDRRNVYDIFRRPTIDSQLLTQLSIVLEHNFFRDIAEMIEIRINEKKPDSKSGLLFFYFVLSTASRKSPAPLLHADLRMTLFLADGYKF